MTLTTYSTQNVPGHQQLEYWNELICKRFTELDCEVSGGASYRGSLSALDLGIVQLSKVDVDPSKVLHSKSRVAGGTEEHMLAHIQVTGRSINRQRHNEKVLLPSDYALCITTEQYSVEFDQPMTMLVAKFNASEFKSRTGIDPNTVTCKKPHLSAMPGTLAGQLAISIWSSRNAYGGASAREALGEAFMATLAAEALAVFGKNTTHTATSIESIFVRAKHILGTHLADPNLNQHALAQMLGVSPRYLRHAFAHQGTTFSRYLLEQRLLRAYRMLKCTPGQIGKVSRVAFECGFNSPAHFTRVFNERFGIPPSKIHGS